MCERACVYSNVHRCWCVCESLLLFANSLCFRNGPKNDTHSHRAQISVRFSALTIILVSSLLWLSFSLPLFHTTAKQMYGCACDYSVFNSIDALLIGHFDLKSPSLLLLFDWNEWKEFQFEKTFETFFYQTTVSNVDNDDDYNDNHENDNVDERLIIARWKILFG